MKQGHIQKHYIYMSLSANATAHYTHNVSFSRKYSFFVQNEFKNIQQSITNTLT